MSSIIKKSQVNNWEIQSKYTKPANSSPPASWPACKEALGNLDSVNPENNVNTVAGKMVQQLRASAAPAQDLGAIPSTYKSDPNSL